MRPILEHLESRFLLVASQLGPAVVHDVNAVPEALAAPDGFQVFGDSALFVGESEHGTAVWRTDGTAEGTRLVDAIPPGFARAHFSVLGAREQFVLLEVDGEVWRTDGTESGTMRLAELYTRLHAQSEDFFLFQRYLSDGSEDGTQRVDGMRISKKGAFVVGDDFFLPGVPLPPSRPDRIARHQLVSTDGTITEVEFPARDIVQLTPDTIAVRQRSNLFITDGSMEGTYEVEARDIGSPNVLIDSFQSGNAIISSWNQDQIWRISPDQFEVQTIASFPTQGFSKFTAFHGLHWFMVTEGRRNTFDRELWFTDGTETGTRKFMDLPVGDRESAETDLHVYMNRLYFFVGNREDGYELWSTDGSSGATRIERGGEGDAWKNPHFVGEIGGHLLLSVESEGHTQLWRTDGTSTGTQEIHLHPPDSTRPSDPRELIAYDDFVYFSADDGDVGRELWRTNGIDRTELVEDLHASGSSDPHNFRIRDGLLFFDIFNGRTAVTDGSQTRFAQGSETRAADSVQASDARYTITGTRLNRLVRLEEGTSSTTVYRPASPRTLSHLTELDDVLFFVELDDRFNDGIAQIRSFNPTTEQLDDVGQFSRAANQSPLIANDSMLVWVPEGIENAVALHDNGQTFRVPLSFQPTHLCEIGVNLTLISGGGQYAITDGTVAGTRDIPHNLIAVVPHGDAILALAHQDSTLQLLVGDRGMRNLRELRSFEKTMSPHWVVNGDRLLFTVEREDAHQIWASDGTDEGTGIVADVKQIERGTTLDELIVTGDRLLFTASHATMGREVWTLPLDQTTGDVTGDRIVTARDIDRLHAAIQVGQSDDVFDINQDTEVNQQDVDDLIQAVLATRFGDFNLDGAVDFEDFLRLAQNYGLRGGWDDGDADGDGEIDFDDFIVLSTQFTSKTTI